MKGSNEGEGQFGKRLGVKKLQLCNPGFVWVMGGIL